MCSCWSANIGVSVSRSPLENVGYEFVLASSAVRNMFVLLKQFMRWEVSVRKAAVL